MQTITKTEPLKNKLISAFEPLKNSLYGNAKTRIQALSSFDKQGIPNRKSEEYKYVNVELILKDNFGLQTSQTLTPEQVKSKKILENAIVVVLENGMFSKKLSAIESLPKGLTILDIQQAENNAAFSASYATLADIQSDAFIALNTALAQGGVFIQIADNAIIESPVHIIHVSSASSNTIINPRLFIHVGKNAQVNLVQSFETVKFDISNLKKYTNTYYKKHIPFAFTTESLKFLCEICDETFPIIPMPELVINSGKSKVIHNSFLFKCGWVLNKYKNKSPPPK